MAWSAGLSPPSATTSGWKDEQWPYMYIADIRRDRAMGALAGIWTQRAKEADWYALPQAAGSFDNYDDPPDSPPQTKFVAGLWHLWWTDCPPTTSPADFRSGRQLGEYAGRPAPGRDAGAWCPEPAELAPTERGWNCGDWLAVLRWDVPGGLEYVSP